MFLPTSYVPIALLDCLIIACCLGIAALAFNKSRLRADSASKVVAIGVIGMVIGAVNLLLDSHWVAPPVNTIVAFFVLIYLTGASKGVLLGLLFSLVLFRQLRPTEPRATESGPKMFEGRGCDEGVDPPTRARRTASQTESVSDAAR